MPKRRTALPPLSLLLSLALLSMAEAGERQGGGHAPYCDPSDIEQIGANVQVTHQSGFDNTATVSQHAVAAFEAEANRATILQHGADNKAAIEQHGDGLNAGIAQFGTNLNARIEQSGHGAGAHIVQSGIGSGLPVVVRQH
jgi:minor curlin subunit